MIKKLFNIVIGSLFWVYVFGQNSPAYSQYMFNPYLVNPAYAGNEGFTEIMLTAREDWIGFVNSPYTHSLSMHGRLLKSKYAIKRSNTGALKFSRGRTGRVGLGGIVYNDRNGLVDRLGFQFSYAYHIFIQNTQLSFGLSGTGHQFRVIASEIDLKDDNDPLLQEVGQSLYVPDANAGVYVRGLGFFGGFSVSQILQNQFYFGDVSGEAYDNFRTLMHYNFMAGINREMKNLNFEFEPSVFIRATNQRVFQVDLNAKFIYKSRHWFGFSARSNKSVIAMIGSHWNRLYFGYAFDFTFSNIGYHTYGSHEIMCGIKLGDNVRRYRWIRRY
jgi:type IX secretion system PorP/SprF family membrane protein